MESSQVREMLWLGTSLTKVQASKVIGNLQQSGTLTPDMSDTDAFHACVSNLPEGTEVWAPMEGRTSVA